MADYFALLEVPRRPWLDPEILKEKFFQLSQELHPDRLHNAPEPQRSQAAGRYSELNSAYQALRETKTRLLHLLTLELGAKPALIQNIPAGTMESFTQTGQICREVDLFLCGKARATSPMMQAQAFAESLEWTEKLEAVLKSLGGKVQDFEAELKGMNAAWESAPPPDTSARAAALPLARIEEIYCALGYWVRWTEQIRERLVQLVL